MSNSSNKLKAVALMVGLLLGGALLGGAVVRLFFTPKTSCLDVEGQGRRERRRGRHHRRYSKKRLDRLVGKFKRWLKLTPEQEKVVRAALGDSWKTMRQIRHRIRPELRKEREAARDRIRAVLDAKQKEKYEKIIQRYERRKAKRRGRRRTRRVNTSRRPGRGG